MANVKQFHRIKAISFDLDGTLVDYKFVESVWFEGIPQLYSVEKKVSFGDARKIVKKEYDKIGKEKLEWYNLQYWIKKFGLNITPQELLRHFEQKIEIYPEVPKVLDELKQRDFRLIIVTNARREFVELELRKAEIENYFNRIFSSTSDFGLVKKTVNLYRRVCNILEISPQEIIHVGDDQNFDFDVPRRLGIMALYLDRTGKHKGELVIHNLEALNKKLQRLRE